MAPVFERLVTKAKQGDLAGNRAVRRVVTSDNAARKLQEELAPAWAERHGGYTRIVKLPSRAGDNAKMAQLSLVLDTVTRPSSQPPRPKWLLPSQPLPKSPLPSQKLPKPRRPPNEPQDR